jgi:hypothetical protein
MSSLAQPEIERREEQPSVATRRIVSVIHLARTARTNPAGKTVQMAILADDGRFSHQQDAVFAYCPRHGDRDRVSHLGGHHWFDG